MIHATKISGWRFEYFSGANGSEWVQMVLFNSSRKKSFALFYKMADLASPWLVLESIDDNFNNTDIVEDDEDIVVLSAVSCFMCRSLTSINRLFWVNHSRYLANEGKQQFRMTKQAFEILSREIILRGLIPLGNPSGSGRPVIPPQKQIFIFLWGLANQEPARP